MALNKALEITVRKGENAGAPQCLLPHQIKQSSF